MIYPSPDKIDKQVDSKYALVILAAKRAKQLKEGSRPRLPTDSTNPLTIALEEIAEGKVQYKFDEQSLAGREAIADQEAVVGARDIEVDMDPLALPDDELARAAAALGADMDDSLLGEDEEASDMLVDEEPEEEEPLILPDDESEGTDI
ncbi:DNA-directed RNA polymerase subunit omega [Armatimonas sp.]|uniref:DNA-directed RNA polymerase subunit omega n=1 Tax=Armatimonas sp. TaxID=1872638 RepID=UPI00286BC1D2|nr:DNA-directed RNA polymerase subunit omega [Armatimonas sp.]